MLRFVLMAFAISTLASCSESEGALSVPESRRKEMESAVINRFHAFVKYNEAGELDNVLMHFDPSGPGTYIDRGIRYNSLQDMIDNYRATWKVRKQDYGIPVTNVEVLSPAYVLVTSASTLNTTTRDGVTFQPRPWSVSLLWTLKDGQWMIHTFHQFDGESKPVEENQAEKK